MFVTDNLVSASHVPFFCYPSPSHNIVASRSRPKKHEHLEEEFFFVKKSEELLCAFVPSSCQLTQGKVTMFLLCPHVMGFYVFARPGGDPELMLGNGL